MFYYTRKFLEAAVSASACWRAQKSSCKKDLRGTDSKWVTRMLVHVGRTVPIIRFCSHKKRCCSLGAARGVRHVRIAICWAAGGRAARDPAGVNVSPENGQQPPRPGRTPLPPKMLCSGCPSHSPARWGGSGGSAGAGGRCRVLPCPPGPAPAPRIPFPPGWCRCSSLTRELGIPPFSLQR